MLRPAVDVVVPFRGPREGLERLSRTLARLRLLPGDTVLIVDNTRRQDGPVAAAVPILHARDRFTPGYARNQGAARGRNEWLVFLDADTELSEDLLDAYFDPEPGERTAVLGSGVRDEPVLPDGPAPARYAYIRGAMSQDDTVSLFGEWRFPKTANAAFRRSAFEAAGGFGQDIGTAEDADLCYRLRTAGWEIERREHATVLHRNRATIRSFVVQRCLYGAGGAWLGWQYPGAFPARRRLRLLFWALRRSTWRLLGAASHAIVTVPYGPYSSRSRRSFGSLAARCRMSGR